VLLICSALHCNCLQCAWDLGTSGSRKQFRGSDEHLHFRLPIWNYSFILSTQFYHFYMKRLWSCHLLLA